MLIKQRWRRLHNINTISKAIEITTAACVLHKFCYLCNDELQTENSSTIVVLVVESYLRPYIRQESNQQTHRKVEASIN